MKISHLFKKKWRKCSHSQVFPALVILMLFISHTWMCTQMLYFKPEILLWKYKNWKRSWAVPLINSRLLGLKLKTKNKSSSLSKLSAVWYWSVSSVSGRNYLFHIQIAPACISNGTSWFWTWRLITCLSLPTSCWPMNTAGKFCRNPSCSSALSICCPFVILSSSYTVRFAPNPRISDSTEWLMQQELLLKITTGFSRIITFTASIFKKDWKSMEWLLRDFRRRANVDEDC